MGIALASGWRVAENQRIHSMEKTTLPKSTVAIVLLASFLATSQACAEPLPRATPESQGIPSAAVLKLIDRLEAQHGMVHSYMLIRHGKVVAEGWWAPFDATTPHALFSISKSFVSMGIGYAVNDRKMMLNDRVAWFFPDCVPADADEEVHEMRVRDLMSMASGQKHDTFDAMLAAAPGEAPREFFKAPIGNPPGMLFRYMSGNTAMLAQIHRKVTGAEDLIAYLRPRLFDKLGIDDLFWSRQRDNTVAGGSGLEMRTEDLAKICLLLLDGGRWHGERLLPLWWVKQATSCQTPYGQVTDPVLALHAGVADNSTTPSEPDDWQVGYGYQLWMGRHESFRLCGAFGQIGAILPNNDIVFVSNAGGRGSNKPSLNAFYDTILPALSDGPLPEDVIALRQLRERSSTLVLPLPEGTAKPDCAAVAAFAKSCAVGTNGFGLASVSYDAATRELVVCNTFGNWRIRVGESEWMRGEMQAEPDHADTLHRIPGGLQPVAAAGAWSAPNHFSAQIRFIRSPAVFTISLEIIDGKTHISTDSNMSKSYRIFTSQ